jgi:hypothetical protein
MALTGLNRAFGMIGKGMSSAFAPRTASAPAYGGQTMTPYDPKATFDKASGEANKAFDSSQTGLAARTDVARGNALKDWQKTQVSGNAPTGGAADLLKTKMMSASESGFAGQASDIESQRAGALSGLASKEGEEAQKQAMFTDQMNFTWAELDETKKNDIVNGLALLHSIDANKWSADEAGKYLGYLRSTYGGKRTENFNQGTIQSSPTVLS